MKRLKVEIFRVLSGVTNIQEFEPWLYTDKEVLKLIENDSFVFEIVNLNYNNKDALHELQKLVFDVFDYEEFLVFMLEVNCSKLLYEEELEKIFQLVLRIGSYYDNEENPYSLIEGFYFYKYEIDCIRDGIDDSKWFENDVKNYVRFILGEMRDRSPDMKIRFLKKANYHRHVKEVEIQTEINKPKNKKWYQFWK